MRTKGNKCVSYYVGLSERLRSKKTHWRKGVAAVLLALLASLFVPYRAGAENTKLHVEPWSTKVWGTGESFAIDIKVTDVNGLYGWQTILHYNPNVLKATGIDEGSFLKTQGETLFNFTLNQTSGEVTAFGTLIGNVSGVSGTGVLLTTTFEAKNLGNSALDLDDDENMTILGDVHSHRIDRTVVDGVVQVVPPIYDIAIESLIATPNKVVDGQTVDVHVIAANRGNRTETFDVTLYCNETVIDTRMVNDLSPKMTRALTFVWDTTGVTSNAVYIIKAEASQVPSETILENNVREDVVEVVTGIHDVAVIGLFPSSQFTYKGRIVNIYAVVKNEGNYTETFDLTVYGNDTAIETKTVNLEYNATEHITFAWNTSNAETNATYLLKAAASLVLGEEDSYNNNCTDGYVTLYPPGLIEIEILELTPCDDSGHAVSSFTAGTTAYFKITVQSTSLEAEQILLTMNLYDSRGTTIGVISFKGPIGSETSTFMPGFPVPETASHGTATVYVNVLTDWPHLGGVPHCPEEYTTFEVVGS